MFHDRHAADERLVFADCGPKRGDTVPNVILLHGPKGDLPPRMPRKVSLTLGMPARAIHLLGGVSRWGWPHSAKGSESMLMRLTYDDGSQEGLPLVNGVHLSDSVARHDVPGSSFAFDLDGRQIRHVLVVPKQTKAIKTIDLVKGDDTTTPIAMAVAAEMP